MSNCALKILPALMVAITAACVTNTVSGSVMEHQLVITENSSVSLSATYDGSAVAITILNTSADHWTLTLPTGVSIPFGAVFGWTEPENSVNGNNLSNPASNDNQILVVSDALAAADHQIFSDGSSGNFLGFDSPGSQAAFNVTFHDLGDTATVPDTGTTCSLFALSLAGLAFLRRKLC